MSEADFFNHYGFVILKHKTEVKSWDHGKEIALSDITETYNKEMEQLIANKIYPKNQNMEVHSLHFMDQNLSVRGLDKPMWGAAFRKYETVIHTDHGLKPRDLFKN